MSVGMCTFNASAWVQDQLDSIAAQTRKPDELVISDDQSTDNTRDILQAFAAVAPFPVHILVNDQKGLAKNFENTFRHCAGEIIVESDHDDAWYPEKLRRIEAVFEDRSKDVGLVFSDSEMVDEKLRPLGYTLWQCINFHTRQQQKVMTGRALEVLFKHNVVSGPTLAFRAKYKDLVLPIPPVGYQDFWIALLIAAVANVALIKAPLVKYRQHTRNQIGSKKRGPAEQVVMARKPASHVYDEAFEQVKLALERLNACKDFHCGDEIRAQFEAKLTHLRARADMPGALSRRLPVIITELLSSRYFKYSNGLRSVGSDLLRTD
jgi:glycosyltransferase involved in cell wall biosynthesis